jgi:hypothetical protein
MKTKLLISTMLIALSFGAMSQVANFEGREYARLNNIDAIIKDSKVQGYYAYATIDKKGKIRTSELTILDNNLSETHKISVVKTKYDRLLDVEFNGTHFCLFYLNTKEKSQELVIYDMAGEKTGRYLLDLKKEWLQYSLNDDDPIQQSLIAIPNEGFAVVKYSKEGGMRTTLVGIDNLGKKSWKTRALSKEKKSYEMQTILFSNEKYVMSLISARKKRLSRKGEETSLFVYDANTGKKQGNLRLNGGKYFLVPSGASYDEKADQFIVYGEYYDRNKQGSINVKEKKGIFLNTFSSTGELINKNLSSWERDIKPKIKFDKTKKGDRNSDKRSVVIHKVVKTNDGSYYAIGEQYQKEVSALGIASNLLAAAQGGQSNASALQIGIYDMMVFKFNSEMEIEDIKIIDKQKRPVILQQGYGLVDKDKMAYYMKLGGYFDYNYTSISQSGDNFVANYVNFDRSENKGSKNKYTIGNITLNDEGEIEVVKVNLDTNPSNFRTFPAKPGYIAVFEYFRKTKTASLRFEKLDI